LLMIRPRSCRLGILPGEPLIASADGQPATRCFARNPMDVAWIESLLRLHPDLWQDAKRLKLCRNLLRFGFEQRGDTPVLLLENLSPSEQRAVLTGQGLQTDDTESFLAEAKERGLHDQNLIMLWRAVQTGSWPATRKEVFELATGLMLREFD
jgi:hypothetical protein